jgi:hypothetical protein
VRPCRHKLFELLVQRPSGNHVVEEQRCCLREGSSCIVADACGHGGRSKPPRPENDGHLPLTMAFHTSVRTDSTAWNTRCFLLPRSLRASSPGRTHGNSGQRSACRIQCDSQRQDTSYKTKRDYLPRRPSNPGSDLTYFVPLHGTVNRKVAPSPGCDSTQILPPCFSTIRLQIASPIPVPGISVLCKRLNTPKMRCVWSG